MKKTVFLSFLLLCTFILQSQESISFQKVKVDSILLEGNRITKPFIILRELSFATGDTLNINSLDDIIKRNESQLMNLRLFNFVDISYKITQNTVTFTIAVTEQWYFWAFPIVEIADRNPNEWWERKDFKRIDYGLFFLHENFRGRNEAIKLKAITGYNRYINLRYEKPFIDRKKQFGIFGNIGYLQSHETTMGVENDQLIFFSYQDENVVKKYEVAMGLSYRKKFTKTHKWTLKYNFYHYHDSILNLNPSFMPNSSSKAQFFSLIYNYIDEHRDFVSYPLNGYYFNLFLVKEGFFNDVIDNWRIKTTYNRYWKLRNRWYLSGGLTLMLTNDNNQPFFLNKEMGYDKNFVRGYENFVVYGNAYFLSRNNLKFQILPNKKFTFNFIPWTQFNKLYLALYLNIFADLGYVDQFNSWQQQNNHLPNTLLFGKGIGLDIVTYYEAVFRLEYSFDKNNHSGFFFHLKSAL